VALNDGAGGPADWAPYGRGQEIEPTPGSTLAAAFAAAVRLRGERTALRCKLRGLWRPVSWAEYGEQVRRIALALIAAGFAPGERACILAENRPQWFFADLAVVTAGGIAVGIYTTNAPEQVAYVLEDCGARFVFVADEEQLDKVLQVRARLPALRRIVVFDMEGLRELRDPMVTSLEAFAQGGAAEPAARSEEWRRRIAAVAPHDTAILIYTSGTTGPPKGAMLTHANLAFQAAALHGVMPLGPGDEMLSFLPLAHIAERLLSVVRPIFNGAIVNFVEHEDTMAQNLRELSPTVFFAVPRIWEKFHAGISGKMALADDKKKKLLGWARGVGTAATAHKASGKPLPLALAAQYKLASKLVFSKLKAAIGLDRARVCVSGAAPVSREVLEFFASLDIMVSEVYGQSEDTGPTSFNRNGKLRYGTVGPAIPGVDVRIAKDDEIIVRGPNVFLGYYKEPEATAETLVEGWLHSGDLGRFDDDGFLQITGRKKEIIITAGGKNIAPKNIEASLKNHPLINEAVVIGDRRKYLTALVTLDADAVAAFCKDRGLDAARAHELAEIRAEVQRAVDTANEELARVEQIKKFAVLARNFGVDTGELTPTLKVKRKKVNEIWGAEIEALYPEGDG